MAEIIYKKESYEVMGACFEVYTQKGNGFTESIYHECLEIELELLRIPFVSQPEIHMSYKDRKLKSYFRPDFICFGKIILEIKAVDVLCDEHKSQLLNYINASQYELGLLVNFGHFPKLEYQRIALSKNSFRDVSRISRAPSFAL